MGCTSSAPNMPDIHTDTTDNADDSSTLNKEDMKNTSEPTQNETESASKKVLPTCDSLNENLQLASNNNSANASNQECLQDDHKSDTCEKDSGTNLPEIEQIPNKFPTLKDVVDHVIIDNVLEDIDNTEVDHEDGNNDDENKVIEKEEVPIQQPDVEDTGGCEESKDEKEVEEIPEELESPSQSECSRATRWEALADIAAELPPSLAVDPITGQIYSLAK